MDDKIYEFLRRICAFGTRNDAIPKDFMRHITGTDNWTGEEGLSFYEFILRNYLDDEVLERMLAVSGLLGKYRHKEKLKDRRDAYVKHLMDSGDNSDKLDPAGKKEKDYLRKIAKSLQNDIQKGNLPKLIELWKAETIEDSETLPGAQDSSGKSETQRSSVESDEQGSGVQPEILISNNANVSPTISNTVTNDNNITVQVHNIIHTETSSDSVAMNISPSNEEGKTSKLLTDKKHIVMILIILLIALLVIMLCCRPLLSKSTSPSVNDSFVSEERVNLRQGEIYEIKTAAFSEGAPSSMLDFVSSDTSIAKVSEKGIVVAQYKSGACEIVVYAPNGKISRISVLVSESKEGISVPEIGDSNEYVSGISLNTKVRNTRKTDSDWEDTVDAAVGDIVEFLMECSVSNNENLNDIIIQDILPQYMEYIPGTIRLYDSEHENGIYLEEDTITTEGIHIEPYLTGTKISFRFAAKIFNVDSNSTPVLLANEARVWDEKKEETLLKDYSYIEARFWGPERPTYTMEQPADHATFNSIIDNPAVGDERDFVRVAEIVEDRSSVYSNEVTLEPGKQYSVFIYFHNNASSTYNDNAHNNVGFAWNTRLSCDFPNKLEAGQRAAIVGRITSTSTEPEMIWDAANITASQNMTLHFVPATARIHSDPKWPMNDMGLSTNLFSQKGTFLGLNELNGTIPGCDEYSGLVVYTIQTYATDDIN